jgi:hypothetical protein
MVNNIDIENYLKMNYVSILLVAALIICLITLFAIKDINLNTQPTYTLVDSATIETMETMDNMRASFCKEYVGQSVRLEEACSKLTEKNCKNISCCGFLNGNKCVSGGAAGPTYKTDDNMMPFSVDSYYYMGKFIT